MKSAPQQPSVLVRPGLPLWVRLAGAAILLVVAGALVTEIGLERATRQQRRAEGREVSLLERAERVAGGPGWSGAAVRGSLVYHWATPHEVLRLDGLWGRRRGGAAPARVLRRNIVTGREIAETVPFPRRARLLSASPDGRWLLWSTTGANETASLLAVGRGGKPVVRWPLPAGSGEAAARQSVWLPDSRGCVTLVADAAGRPLRLVRHRFPTNGIDAPAAASLPVRTPPGVAFAGAGWLRGITGDGRYALVLDASSVTGRTRRGRRKNASLKLILVPLVPSAPPPGAVALPEPAVDNAIAAVPVVSPRGDRLAWLVTRWQPRPAGANAAAPFAPPRMSLWVSRLPALAGGSGDRATNPRLLGTVSLGPLGRRPRGLQWSPDNKRLSFLYGDALWAVPVDANAR